MSKEKVSSEKLMASEDVVDLYKELENLGIKIRVDGGWSVDALLGEQTRPHKDFDIVIQQKDIPKLRELLEAQGYKDVERDDTSPWNFVLGDDKGHEVRCISPEYMVKFISPWLYKLRDRDRKDVSALCEKFGIELPIEYTHLKK